MRSGAVDRATVFPIELFFDLVYVFAITQIAHLLLEHLEWRYALRAFIVLAAVWWAWIYTAWFTNWLDPRKAPTAIVIIILMFLSLVMSASIPEAFGHRGLGFAGGFVAMQLIRSLFFVWAVKGEEAHRARNFQRIFAWSAMAGVFWVGGALVEGTNREIVWLIAVAIELIGPLTSFALPVWGRSDTRQWDVDGKHLAERCSLFIIIALGESLLSTGRAFADHPITPEVATAFIFGFLSSVAFAWIYFYRFAGIAEHAVASSDNPGRFARSAYTYSHGVLVAGIVLAAVGDELVIAHPTGDVEPAVALVVLGCAAVYLLGMILFRATITGSIPYAMVAGIAVLAAVWFVHSAMTPLMLGIATALVVFAAAIITDRQNVRLQHSR
jgi:low temperature requirement protein LtrA